MKPSRSPVEKHWHVWTCGEVLPKTLEMNALCAKLLFPGNFTGTKKVAGSDTKKVAALWTEHW